MPSLFETSFATIAAPGLKTRFGVEVLRWPEGDFTAKVTETWLVGLHNEEGENSGLADKLTMDRKGESTDVFISLIGDNEIAVTRHDKFEFTHPATGNAVLAHAVRRLEGGPMQIWVAVIAGGIDSKGARVRR